MIQYWTNTEGKKCFYQPLSSDMGISYSEIGKEEYERLSAMTYSEVEDEIENTLPSYLAGYGYYGHSLFHDKEQDVYLMGLKRGSSCD